MDNDSKSTEAKPASTETEVKTDNATVTTTETEAVPASEPNGKESDTQVQKQG